MNRADNVRLYIMEYLMDNTSMLSNKLRITCGIRFDASEATVSKIITEFRKAGIIESSRYLLSAKSKVYRRGPKFEDNIIKEMII